MAEEYVLTTPETKPNITRWLFDSLYMSKSAQIITATFISSEGDVRTCQDTGAAATQLMATLNTANLTSNSLRKRAFTWAASKNTFGAGTIAGTPD